MATAISSALGWPVSWKLSLVWRDSGISRRISVAQGSWGRSAIPCGAMQVRHCAAASWSCGEEVSTVNRLSWDSMGMFPPSSTGTSAVGRGPDSSS